MPMKSLLQENRKRNRKRSKSRRVTRGVVLFMGILVVIFIVLFLPQLRISNVVVEGTAIVPMGEVRAVAQAVLNKKFSRVFPGSNIFLADLNAIEDNIYNSFHFISQADITRSFNTITILVKERSAWGVFCSLEIISSDSVPRSSSELCYHLDYAGTAYEQATSMTDTMTPRVRDKQVSGGIHVPQKVIDEETFNLLDMFKNGLQNHLSIELTRASINDEYTGSIVLTTSEGWDIIVEKHTNSNRALENMLLVLNTEIKDRVNLEYMDLRIDHKVFYK